MTRSKTPNREYRTNWENTFGNKSGRSEDLTAPTPRISLKEAHGSRPQKPRAKPQR